ncbi:MAG: DUF2281 domain-containing protein [Leptospiraceae bacterium]|nr:DUF2281 domain-containing protein [Leptospiraceae bacterium]
MKSMDSQILLDNFQKLPPIAKQEVIDFMSFLLYKHQIPFQMESFSEELTDEEKEFLDLRYSKMMESPHLNRTWDEVKKDIYTKHNWK